MLLNIEKTKIVRIFATFSLLTYTIYYFGSYIGFFENYLIFFGKEDRFTDFFKLVYSFLHIFSIQDLANLNVPNNLIGIDNPYSLILSNGASPNMGHPPLTIILITITAYTAKLVGFHYSIVYFLFLAFLTIFLYKMYISNLKENFLLIFILLSFPLLFLIERGNIWAAVSGCFLLLLFRNFLYKKQLNSIDLIYFVLACSIRPNYLVFGLLFLTDKSVYMSLKKFFKVGVYFTVINSFFLLIAMWVFPGYNFGYFRFLVDRYAYSNIRFNSWNSSLHGFIYNIYISILDSQILQFPDNFVQRIEELIIGQGVNKLILTGYFIVLIFSFLNLRLKKMDKLSFLTTICCFTAITTSPFADYHLIIFIFLFFFVYDSYNNSNKHVVQLILISAILLPKFHAIPPEINIHNIVNVICLNFLLFVSFIKYKSDNQH